MFAPKPRISVLWVERPTCGFKLTWKGVIQMARKSKIEVTSKKAASAASKVLRNPKSSKDAKTAAASALAQRPNKKK